jgi:hypothetical protein
VGKQAFYSEIAEGIANSADRARFLKESALR